MTYSVSNRYPLLKIKKVDIFYSVFDFIGTEWYTKQGLPFEPWAFCSSKGTPNSKVIGYTHAVSVAVERIRNGIYLVITRVCPILFTLHHQLIS